MELDDKQKLVAKIAGQFLAAKFDTLDEKTIDQQIEKAVTVAKKLVKAAIAVPPSKQTGVADLGEAFLDQFEERKW